MAKKKKVPIHVFYTWAKKKAEKYKEYRLHFYNFMLEAQKRVGLLLKIEMQKRANKFVDTGTMRKRTDFKVLQWNSIAFGIFEPNSQYYNETLHNPTGKVSKYTGRVVPPDAVYARYPYKRDDYVADVVKRMYRKEMKKEVNEFNKKYLVD